MEVVFCSTSANDLDWMMMFTLIKSAKVMEGAVNKLECRAAI